jgi:hypothetical protein
MGGYLMEGMAIGISSNAKLVKTEIVGVGNAIKDNMSNSLRAVEDASIGELDIQPVIAPVIDLTQFRKDAAGMSAELPEGALTAKVSASEASAIVAEKQEAAAAAEADTEVAPEAKVINFTQNNNSPKALSEVEIYRSTKNILSMAKEA